LKIAFDENVPAAMVRVFQTFATERQLKKLISGTFVIESAKQYTPKRGDSDYVPSSDVPWLKRFALAGGKAVISGNTDMKRQPHERLALIECGFIVIFCESQWSNWKFFPKCALLLHCWPVIAAKLKRAPAGSFWHIPCNWPEKGKLRKISNEDPRLLKIERRQTTAPTRKRSSGALPPRPTTHGPLFDFVAEKKRRARSKRVVRRKPEGTSAKEP
jgi:hypothetical protein